MAANKFATILHKNTNKMTLILVYALLEWTLIILLLLNSLFSYLIIKFADYFGLKRPCLWCSRIDHFLEPRKRKNILHEDLLCEAHATEISKMGYCSNHQMLSDYRNMCDDCSSSRPDYGGVSKNMTFLPWVKEIGKAVENCEGNFSCSCCGVSFENHVYSPYVLINPDHFKCNEKVGNNLDQFSSDHGFGSKDEKQWLLSNVNGGEDKCDGGSPVSLHSFVLNAFESNEQDTREISLEENRESTEENCSVKVRDLNSYEPVIQDCGEKDGYFQVPSQHLSFFIDCSGQQLVPVELVEENQEKVSDFQEVHLGSESNIVVQDEDLMEKMCCVEEQDVVYSVEKSLEETKFGVFESMDLEEIKNSLVFKANECDLVYELVDVSGAGQISSVEISEIQEVAARADADEVYQVETNKTGLEVIDETETALVNVEDRESDDLPVGDEVSIAKISETEAEISIGTEIPDLSATDEVHEVEDPSTSYTNFHENHEHGSKSKFQEETVEFKTLSIEVSDHKINKQISISSDANGIEEEKMPDTPTSSDSFHQLHKKLRLLERKESGTEESLNGSDISEFDGGDGGLSVARLTSALRAERKALHVVYAELEEERSASAIAANQTMAMINRLQEEKAAMQMEALQYQRMMEEQAEYDQEALQLMNELMVKREKEKQELEKELDFCRKRLSDYEAKEKMRLLRRRKNGSTTNGFSSASCSNGEDSDGISIDFNQETKEENGFYGHHENGHHNTPVDPVIDFGDSFGDFEEERMFIIEQLKVLEDKLFALSEDEQHLKDLREVKHSYQENNKHVDESDDPNGDEANGVKEINGEHRTEGRAIGAKAKRLLPLFDAVNGQNDIGILNEHDQGLESVVTRFELEDRRAAIEEEVDQLYARMHALETDKEFLKHCFSSLKKGDKGVDLLQEILHHLRDFRNVELRVKNYTDSPLV